MVGNQSTIYRKPVWVNNPAFPSKEGWCTVAELTVSGGNISFTGRGYELEMWVETEENFSWMMDACNLHLNKICISAHSTIPHNYVAGEERSELKHSDSMKLDDMLQSYYNTHGSFEVSETEKLDGGVVVKTMKAMQALKDPLKKAICTYSEKITSPYPRTVFGGLFESLDMVVNAGQRSDNGLKGDIFDTKAAQRDLADYSKDRIKWFRVTNNTLKHVRGYTHIEDVSRGVVEFRPVVAKLLLKHIHRP